ncbi:MAG: helix-turn-helix domain-containing protein, partial [Clostridia bacterium]|nr:helix-turn-helix domain-containing protein [Clostridia bacterium]
MKNKVHNYPNPDLVETGEKIRALRESSGMSQEQLAELVGVSKNSIHRYENGNVEMKMIIMFKIAFALEVSPYELAPAHYRVRNIEYAVIRGGITDRDEQIRKFQNDITCLVFVGQIAAAGLGITLTAASTMIF